MGIILAIICAIDIFIYNRDIRKRKSKKEAAKKQQKKFLFKHTVVVVCIYILLSFTFIPVVQDIINPQTQTITGTVKQTSIRHFSYKNILIETENGEITLICHLTGIDKYNLDINDTYEFEYFINSKTLKNAELLEDN